MIFICENKIKKIVNWQLKYSLFATLGQKYNKNVAWAIRKFGKTQPKIIVDDKSINFFLTTDKDKSEQSHKKKIINQITDGSHYVNIFILT